MSTNSQSIDITAPDKPRHAGGRPPTSYKPEYCDALVEYFTARFEAITSAPPADLPPDERGGKGSSRIAAQRIYSEFPTLAGFAASINTHEQRLYEWQHRHPEFAESRARVIAVTKHLLVNGMLDGRYNAQAAQFVAKNLTDMRDKVEIENVNSGDSDLVSSMRSTLSAASPEQLDQFRQLIEAMQARTTVLESAP